MRGEREAHSRVSPRVALSSSCVRVTDVLLVCRKDGHRERPNIDVFLLSSTHDTVRVAIASRTVSARFASHARTLLGRCVSLPRRSVARAERGDHLIERAARADRIDDLTHCYRPAHATQPPERCREWIGIGSGSGSCLARRWRARSSSRRLTGTE